MSISSTLVERAEIQFREAAEPLQPFVGCFWVIAAERDATIRVVPDGSTTISILLEPGRAPEWMLRGPLVVPEERRFATSSLLVGIRLRPGVAFLLSGIPSYRLIGVRLPVDRIGACRDLVTEPPLTPERCIDALQGFLLNRLERASLQPVVAAALHEIERAHGLLRASELAARCGVSARHLHRLMRVWVGYGPKAYANIIRFCQRSFKTPHLWSVKTPHPPAAVRRVW